MIKYAIFNTHQHLSMLHLMLIVRSVSLTWRGLLRKNANETARNYVPSNLVFRSRLSYCGQRSSNMLHLPHLQDGFLSKVCLSSLFGQLLLHEIEDD